MLNKEAIQRFQSAYSSGVQSDNSRLASRHIFNVLCSTRSTFLTQEQKKNQRVSSFAYQTLPCIELVLVPDNECPCTPQLGCMILKSKYEIPSFMVGASASLFTITGLGGSLSISETTFEEAKYKKGNKYTKTKPDFFIKDRYLYITITQKLETVTGQGLFNNPLEAYNFPNACKIADKCKSYLEYEFPFEDDLMSGLVDVASRELIDRFNNSKQDIKNDGRDGNKETQG